MGGLGHGRTGRDKITTINQSWPAAKARAWWKWGQQGAGWMGWIVDRALDGWVPMSMGDVLKNEGDLSDHLKRSGNSLPCHCLFPHPPTIKPSK